MSKKKHREILAKFIGLNTAHKILILFTNKLESIKKLQSEADHYDDLSMKLAQGNWDAQDIEQIEALAEKQCIKKLEQYEDIGNKKYSMIDQVIQEMMRDLELK